MAPILIENLRVRLNDSRRAVSHHLRQRDWRGSSFLHPSSECVPQVVDGEVSDVRFLQRSLPCLTQLQKVR